MNHIAGFITGLISIMSLIFILVRVGRSSDGGGGAPNEAVTTVIYEYCANVQVCPQTLTSTVGGAGWRIGAGSEASRRAVSTLTFMDAAGTGTAGGDGSGTGPRQTG